MAADLSDEATVKRPYWVQRADLSARDYDPISLVDAEIALRFHNWQLELAYWRSLIEKEAEDECPPGIGFWMGEGGDWCLLHICPNENGTADCSFTQNDAMFCADDLEELAQLRLLQLFFRSDYEQMKGLLPVRKVIVERHESCVRWGQLSSEADEAADN
jgi:hypothetical protein